MAARRLVRHRSVPGHRLRCARHRRHLHQARDRVRQGDGRGAAGQALDARHRSRPPGRRGGGMTSTFVTRDLGPAPEPVLALDPAKHALAFAPVPIAVCAAIWGAARYTSAASALATVLANLALAP